MNRGRMNIFRPVRIPVVVTVMGSPPDRSALDGRIPQNGKQKLPYSIRLKCLMGKIPVIKSGDGKHPKDVKQNGDDNRRPAPPDPDDAQAARMQDNKW